MAGVTLLLLCVAALTMARLPPSANAARVVDSTVKLTGQGSKGLISTGFGEEENRIIASEFAAFKLRYGKEYGSPEEEHRRLQIFADSWMRVQSRNAAGLTYTLELNEMADLSWAEFKRTKLGAMQNCSATHGNFQPPSNAEPPSKMDWRETGIVSPVKSQGHCGSCWTFSTTGALEAAFKQKHGKNVSLSEQQLVDCAQAFNNHGCEGGLPSQAFEYVKYNGGLDTEEAYPYHALDEACHFTTKDVGVTVADIVNITQYDEASLLQAVAFVRPVSIAFEVADDFTLYKGGIYSSQACRTGPDTVNHAVLAVGYDLTAQPPYWIVKNSWGSAWGEDGYFRIHLGVNMCGVATCASYPVV